MVNCFAYGCGGALVVVDGKAWVYRLPLAVFEGWPQKFRSDVPERLLVRKLRATDLEGLKEVVYPQ